MSDFDAVLSEEKIIAEGSHMSENHSDVRTRIVVRGLTALAKRIVDERDSLRAKLAAAQARIAEMEAQTETRGSLATKLDDQRSIAQGDVVLLRERLSAVEKERDEAYSMRDSMLKERADAAKRWKGFEKKSRAYRRKVDAKLSLAREALGRAQKRATKSIYGSACQCEDCRLIRDALSSLGE